MEKEEVLTHHGDKEAVGGGIRILLVIPTYNNRATLRIIAEAALRSGYPLLVVNDGSTDGALDTLQESQVEVRHLCQRRLGEVPPAPPAANIGRD